MVGDFTAKTVWNMDEARMRQIDRYLIAAEECFLSWDLESLYSYLNQVRRIAAGKFKETEYDDLGKIMGEIEYFRRALDIDSPHYDNYKIQIFNLCDKYYVELNRLLKKHGVYFREGDDPTRAALKR